MPLVITEGDSAKALAVSGLSVVGRDYYGVYPVQGKLLNVREAKTPELVKNDEILNLIKIIGKFNFTSIVPKRILTIHRIFRVTA